MRAGYSIENAWREAKKDVIQQYGMESDMAVEMRQMIHQMDCNVPLEQLLEDFAERSRIEDVEQFAGILLQLWEIQFGRWQSGWNCRKP